MAAGAGGRAALPFSVTDTAGRAGLAAPVQQVPGSQAYFTPGSSDGDSRGPCPGPSCARTGPDQPTLEALVPGGGTTRAALGASCPREAGVRRASAQAPSPPGPVARGPRAVEGGSLGLHRPQCLPDPKCHTRGQAGQGAGELPCSTGNRVAEACPPRWPAVPHSDHPRHGAHRPVRGTSHLKCPTPSVLVLVTPSPWPQGSKGLGEAASSRRQCQRLQDVRLSLLGRGQVPQGTWGACQAWRPQWGGADAGRGMAWFTCI